jgi:tetratricopeptide (TPR) repeat protein
MLHRYWFWGMILAVSSGLLSGCGASAGRRQLAQGQNNSAHYKSDLSLDQSTDRRAKAHAHYAAGVIYDVNEDADAALREYYQAALNDPDNEPLVLEVSRRLLQTKQVDKALDLLKRAAASPNASGAIFARLGVAYAELGKNDQAVSAGRMAIKKAPASLAGYQNLAVYYLQTKQTDEALKILDEANRQSHADADFLIGLAELYANYGLQMPKQREQANAKALAVLSRAEKLGPGTPALRMKLADGFSLLGDSKKAAELYLELLKTLPDVPAVRERVRAKLTEIYLRGQDHDSAVEQLKANVREDPTNPQYYYLLGCIAYEQKKMAEATDYFSKTLLLRPDFEPAFYDLASAQIALKQTSEALEVLDKARKKFPQNFVMEYLSGIALSSQKDYAEAFKRFTAAEVVAKATEPKRLTESFYFQVGAACERKGDLEGAESYFEKSLSLAPDFTEALNYLGYMWAEHGLKLDRARTMIEKAVKAEPENAAYLDSMAWVLYKQNQPKEALSYAKKAIEFGKEPDATVYDHLGDIYAALSQPEKAREAWNKSLSLEPNEQIRKKLEASKPVD